MMLERIRREHGYMVRLLDILREKLQLVQQEQPINYSLIKEVIEYLGQHAQVIHHPKEDVLYSYYQQHYSAAPISLDLTQEHHQLEQQTQSFALLIDMILQDAVIPQDLFADKLKEFIDCHQQHLEMEERDIFPAIERRFTVSDWQQVESIWTHQDVDPVFGETIAEQYVQLARRVRRSESECI